MGSTPIELPVRKLRSPLNGQIVLMQFWPGTTPTLEAMLRAGFTVEDDEPVKVKRPNV